MEMKCYYVYMLASQKNGTLYIGVTNDLQRRVQQHKSGVVPGFTHRYSVNRPVYFETFCRIGDALTVEKRLKKWNRQWKIRLIEERNPEWKDLYKDRA